MLETELETDSGAVRLIDFMPPRETKPDVVRIVEGVRGRVEMAMELVIRFDYGSIVPWVRNVEGTLIAIAGPDALLLRTPVEHEGRDLRTVAEFAVSAGERVPFVLRWFPSNEPPPAIRPDPRTRSPRRSRSGRTGQSAARTRGAGTTPSTARS